VGYLISSLDVKLLKDLFQSEVAEGVGDQVLNGLDGDLLFFNENVEDVGQELDGEVKLEVLVLILELLGDPGELVSLGLLFGVLDWLFVLGDAGLALDVSVLKNGLVSADLLNLLGSVSSLLEESVLLGVSLGFLNEELLISAGQLSEVTLDAVTDGFNGANKLVGEFLGNLSLGSFIALLHGLEDGDVLLDGEVVLADAALLDLLGLSGLGDLLGDLLGSNSLGLLLGNDFGSGLGHLVYISERSMYLNKRPKLYEILLADSIAKVYLVYMMRTELISWGLTVRFVFGHFPHPIEPQTLSEDAKVQNSCFFRSIGEDLVSSFNSLIH